MRSVGLRQYAPKHMGADPTALMAWLYLDVLHEVPSILVARLQGADRLTCQLDDGTAGHAECLVKSAILVELVPTPNGFNPTSVAGVVERPQELAIGLRGRSQDDEAPPCQQIAALGLHLAAERLAAKVPLDAQPGILEQPADRVRGVKVEVERDLDAPQVVGVDYMAASVKRDQRDAVRAKHPVQLRESRREVGGGQMNDRVEQDRAGQ